MPQVTVDLRRELDGGEGAGEEEVVGAGEGAAGTREEEVAGAREGDHNSQTSRDGEEGAHARMSSARRGSR